MFSNLTEEALIAKELVDW